MYSKLFSNKTVVFISQYVLSSEAIGVGVVVVVHVPIELTPVHTVGVRGTFPFITYIFYLFFQPFISLKTTSKSLPSFKYFL